MGRYRLLAVDLDGTLFDHSRELPAATLSELAGLRQAGVLLVLATGRMVQATLPFARALGVDTPLITYQGALIASPDGQKVLMHRPLPASTALQVVQHLQSSGMHVNVYLNDTLYVKALTAEALAYTELAGVSAVVPPDWDGFLQCPEAAGGSLRPTKLVAIGPPEEVARHAAGLKSRFGDEIWVSPSQPDFLEVCHPKAGKGQALQWVAEHFGVSLGETVAVGDGLNDLDMLACAGLAVAMGNAHPELKRIAAHITGTVHDAGVAQLVRWLKANHQLG